MNSSEHNIGTALEGVSYVGKTTTLKCLSERDKKVIVVPEYFQIGVPPKFDRTNLADAKAASNIIIDLEKRRTDYLNDRLAKPGRFIVFWDRSPVSCIAFDYALEQTGYVGSLHYLAERFQREYVDGNIILPQSYAFLYLSLKDIQERERCMLERGHRKNLGFLSEPEVIGHFNFVYDQFQTISSHTMRINSADFVPEQIANMVLNFALIPSEHEKFDFQKFAGML